MKGVYLRVYFIVMNNSLTTPPEQEESAPNIIVDPTIQELHQKVQENQRQKESLVSKPPSGTGPHDDLALFRYKARLDGANMDLRHSVTQLLAASPNVVDLAADNQAYKVTFNGYQGNWKAAIEDPKLTALVQHTTALQHAALAGADPDARVVITPDGKVLAGQIPSQDDAVDIDLTAMEKDARSESLKRTDAMIGRQQERFAQKATNPDARVILTPPKNTGSDIDPSNVGSLGEKGVPKTPEEYRALAENYLNKSRESQERVEKVTATLEKREEKASSRLLEMGLTGLVKGLESFKNVKPKHKLAIGLALAGASVASGGLTSVLSKVLSTASYASSHYHEKIKALEEQGVEFDTRKVAVQSLTRGVILALASSELISYLAPNIPGALDTVTEKFSSVKESVKSWFLSLTEATPVESMPIKGLDMERSVPVDHSLSGKESLGTPLVVAPLPEYVIQSGDNLTKIIREQVFKTIPGIENLTDFQKNNIIENLLQQAKENSTSPFGVINQFSNPNVIQPGKTLDLNEIRQSIIGYQHNNFGGDTFLEHAKKVTSGAFSGGGGGGGIGSFVSSSEMFPDGGGGMFESPPTEPSRVVPDSSFSSDNIPSQGDSNPLPEKENPRIQGEGYLTNA